MPAAFESLPRDVQVALQRGQHLEAARLLRQATGVSLKSAQARIEAAVRQGVPQAHAASHPVKGGQAAAGARPQLATVAARLVALLREQAAKQVHGKGLDARQGGSGLAPGEQPRNQAGDLAAWAVVAILVGVLLWKLR